MDRQLPTSVQYYKKGERASLTIRVYNGMTLWALGEFLTTDEASEFVTTFLPVRNFYQTRHLLNRSEVSKWVEEAYARGPALLEELGDKLLEWWRRTGE